MIQIIPKSAVLTYLVMLISQLNCAWDFILYQSFFQTRGIMLQEYGDEKLGMTRYYNEDMVDSDESAECAVCLCSIDEGDDVRELRCDHLFHKVCLDRWEGYGHATCPLCRNNLKPPRFTAELHQELIMINFCAAVSSRDGRSTWWLR